MSNPCQSKCCRDQENTNDPVEPDNDERGESHWNRDRMESPIDRLGMGVVVMCIESHGDLQIGKGYCELCCYRNELFKYFVGEQSASEGETDRISITFEQFVFY